ncbi:MAG: hypothetical protein NTZ38_01085 [Candidatus Taylorbacteria bacterium]|nr:hypothetical protein [Candidatus Taylorbacteria bacterium]
MSKRQSLMLLGLLIIIVPFMGFPSSWDSVILFISGLAIIAIAYSLAPKTSIGNKDKDLPFTENRNDSNSSEMISQPNNAILEDQTSFSFSDGQETIISDHSIQK